MKKFLAIVLAIAMMLSMVSIASASSLAGTYKIKVWVADAMVDLTKAQIQRFNETNELGIVFEAEVQPQGEGDAASNMVLDVEAGADIFCFAQDQLSRLITANALAKLGQGASQKVAEEYDPDSVQAVTVGDSLWAYPLTADNDYFMYYDKSVIPDDAVDSLEKLIEISGAYTRYIIPADAYGTDGDVVTVGMKATIIANEKVTDEQAYTIVKTIFENKDAITEVHAKGADLDLEFASVCGLPYHPGAAKYFAEKGITVETK